MRINGLKIIIYSLSRADSKNNPHIIWDDSWGIQSREIYYAMLNGSNGNHLIDATLITDDDDVTSSRADIVVDDEDKVHVFWSERVDAQWREIYYKKLDPSLDDKDGDSADESAITVINDRMVSSDDDWRSSVPQAAFQCGYIHVTWKDDRYDQDEGGNRDPPADVFYMVLDTDGDVVVPETGLTTGSNLCYMHDSADNVIPVAVDANGKAHMAWCDHRTDDHEIWYTSYQGPACQYRPVGGEAYPVKADGIIAPLIGLAVATAAGVFVIRHRKVS